MPERRHGGNCGDSRAVSYYEAADPGDDDSGERTWKVGTPKFHERRDNTGEGNGGYKLPKTRRDGLPRRGNCTRWHGTGAPVNRHRGTRRYQHRRGENRLEEQDVDHSFDADTFAKMPDRVYNLSRQQRVDHDRYGQSDTQVDRYCVPERECDGDWKRSEI